jgi:D-alanine-D-alanine ligase
LKIAVIFGGPSPEHDISILTGLQVLRTLISKYEVVSIYWTKSGNYLLIPNDLEPADFLEDLSKKGIPLSFRVTESGGFYDVSSRLSKKEKKLEFDSLVNCCHGGPGESGALQGALDICSLNYTGPNLSYALLGMDKLSFGLLMKSTGIETLERYFLDDSVDSLPFGGPYIVKPRFGGSSIGIDVVADLATAKSRLSSNIHLKAGAVIEPYRDDLYDIQIAVKSYPTLMLSAIERPLKRNMTNEILSYKDKYLPGQGMEGASRELPANLDQKIADKIRNAAVLASKVLAVRGISRFDFMVNETEVYINEVNTIPGSLSRYMFVDPKVEFIELLEDMIAESRINHQQHYSTQGADGSALKNAESVASKLMY